MKVHLLGAPTEITLTLSSISKEMKVHLLGAPTEITLTLAEQGVHLFEKVVVRLLGFPWLKTLVLRHSIKYDTLELANAFKIV